MKLTIPERPGRCRWCGCTYDDPCPPGCGWANRRETLCTECVVFDQMIRTAAGRRVLMETHQIGAYAATDQDPAVSRERLATFTRAVREYFDPARAANTRAPGRDA